MLSKTAMALIPAASLVGAAALAPTTSLAKWARTTVSSRSTIPIARKTLGTASVGETLMVPLPARSEPSMHPYRLVGLTMGRI